MANAGQPLHLSTVGAGDTFIAGILYCLLCHNDELDTQAKLAFAVQLATRKVQSDGFRGLGAGMRLH